MKKRLIAATLIALFTTLSMYAPPFSVTQLYYNDYFVTPVGGDQTDCDQWYQSWGTLDGNYKEVLRDSCTGTNSTHWCYQKVGGSWVQIACP